MICPNCKNESNGARWCPMCGIQLETDDAALSMYAQPEKKQNSYEPAPSYNDMGDENDNKKLKITLAIICPLTAIVLIFVILTMTGVIKLSPSKESTAAQDENVVLEKEDADTLMKTGMNQLKIGDYEEAETVFKAVLEIDPENEEAAVLCQIVYNYNRGLKKIQSKKYKEARTFFDKIPAEYMDYPICEDVEDLENEIIQFETTYITFSNMKNYMRNGDYEDAMEMFSIIDERYLEDTDIELLAEYREQIDRYIKEEEEEKERKEKEENELSFKRAEIIITEYCEDYVRAINNKDFSIVAGHLSGQLYDQQKKQVQSCIDSGITESLDKVVLKDVHNIAENKWKASVTEGETIYYANGTAQTKEFEWVYTIEYIDSSYYLTKIE